MKRSAVRAYTTKVGIGENGIEGELGLVLLDILPGGLLAFSLACAVDCPFPAIFAVHNYNVCFSRSVTSYMQEGGSLGRRSPSVLDCFLIPHTCVDMEFLIRFRICSSRRGGSQDEALETRFFLS